MSVIARALRSIVPPTRRRLIIGPALGSFGRGSLAVERERVVFEDLGTKQIELEAPA